MESGPSKIDLNIQLMQMTEKIRRLESLIDVTAIISSVLDLEELLILVMEKAQTVMCARASSVLLLNDQTGRLECEVALGEVGSVVRQKVSLELGQGIAGWVAEQGEPLLVVDAQNDPRFDARSDVDTGFYTQSVLAVPLKVKNKIIGVAEVLNPIDGCGFTESDMQLFMTFSRQVALAIENARYHHMLVEREKMNQQLEAAHAIQESFMPQDFPQCLRGRFSVWALNRPARILGGDFYDFFEFKDTDELGLVIGDVSGKGIPAALFMARLVSDLRFNCFMAQTPADCLQAMNRALSIQARRGMFVTLLYLILQNSTGRLKITNAGHLPLIWFHRETGKAELIQHSSGIPLAVLPEAEFDTRTIQLAHGDAVLMFTDGIIEAKNSLGDQFSMPRLLQSFQGTWQTPEELLNGIAGDLAAFSQETPQHDDMTMVAFTWHRGNLLENRC